MTPALYRQILGSAFDALPEPLRHLHDLASSTRFIGEAEVIAGANPLARLIATLTGFPTKGGRCAVEVRITIDADGETWQRDFGGQRFHSRLYAHRGILTEHLGPHRIQFDLCTDASGLSMHPRAWRIFGIPLPRLLWPKISAHETEVDGRFHFDVATAFPMIGTVIRYRGSLRPD